MARKPRPTRYEKILARADQRRPLFIKELPTEPWFHEDALVLKCNVLLPNGGTVRYTWSETLANQAAARERLKGEVTPAVPKRRRVVRGV